MQPCRVATSRVRRRSSGVARSASPRSVAGLRRSPSRSPRTGSCPRRSHVWAGPARRPSRARSPDRCRTWPRARPRRALREERIRSRRWFGDGDGCRPPGSDPHMGLPPFPHGRSGAAEALAPPRSGTRGPRTLTLNDGGWSEDHVLQRWSELREHASHEDRTKRRLRNGCLLAILTAR